MEEYAGKPMRHDNSLPLAMQTTYLNENKKINRSNSLTTTKQDITKTGSKKGKKGYS